MIERETPTQRDILIQEIRPRLAAIRSAASFYDNGDVSIKLSNIALMAERALTWLDKL